jgi:hypothetical protein
MVGVLTAWRPRPPMREQEWTAADIAGHSAVAVRRAVQVPDTRGRTAASGVRPAGTR